MDNKQLEGFLASNMTDPNGNDATDPSLSLFGKPSSEVGLHDLFQVSQQEENNWYDQTSRKIASFQELMDEYTQNGLDVETGYVRDAVRTYADQCRTYFGPWLDMYTDMIRSNSLKFSDPLAHTYMRTFQSLCYFAAEYHIEEYFHSIVACMNELLQRKDPLFADTEFTCQHASSVLYNAFDGDFDALMRIIYDENTHMDLRQWLGEVVVQYAKDGVFSPEKEQKLLDDYVNYVLKNDVPGIPASEWIVLAGQKNAKRKKLKKLLEEYIPFHYLDTEDPDEFEEKIKKQEDFVFSPLLLMDHIILYGMYPKALHIPEDALEKTTHAQQERIRRMKEQMA